MPEHQVIAALDKLAHADIIRLHDASAYFLGIIRKLASLTCKELLSASDIRKLNLAFMLPMQGFLHSQEGHATLPFLHSTLLQNCSGGVAVSSYMTGMLYKYQRKLHCDVPEAI